MLKPQIPLTKQLAPLIIFLAIVILCTLVISNRRAAKKRAQEAAILPMEEQPEAVRNAFLLGGSGEMARYDAQLDETLRALFQSIGQSAHLKKHYFDYYNSLFLLHKLFLQVCADPAAPLSDGAWKDLALYLGDRTRLSGLVAQRLSFGARRAFAGPAQERPVSLRK